MANKHILMKTVTLEELRKLANKKSRHRREAMAALTKAEALRRQNKPLQITFNLALGQFTVEAT